MKRPPSMRKDSHWALRWWVAVCLALLASCGGSGINLSGGVGSGGTGVAEGAISGFGSVIVDGVEYDDSQARVVTEKASGATELAEAKLGQRARLTLSSAGTASEIRVLPQLIGTASRSSDANGWFQILGQWVRIISANDADNTPTVLDGLTSVNVGDELEIHGVWVSDATRNHSVLLASRIEKLSTPANPVLLSGIVRSTSGTLIVLDDAAGTPLQTDGGARALTQQSLVSAWVDRAALGASPLPVLRLMDTQLSLSTQQTLTLGAQIGARDLALGEVVVQGLRVKLPANFQNNLPALGTAVQMTIVSDGATWQAQTLTPKQSNSELGGEVLLKGSLSWNPSTTTLTLRGTPVAVAAGALGSSCNGLPANSAVYLEVKATRTAPGGGLQARQVTCSLQIPSQSVIEAEGQLVNLQALQQTLVLQTAQGNLALTWNANSLLPSKLETLLNRMVEVEYQRVGNVLQIRKIKLK
jgi:hypothetical protein